MIELVATLTFGDPDLENWTKYVVQYETQAECAMNTNALVGEFVKQNFVFNLTDTFSTGSITMEKGDAVLDVFCREVVDVNT